MEVLTICYCLYMSYFSHCSALDNYCVHISVECCGGGSGNEDEEDEVEIVDEGGDEGRVESGFQTEYAAAEMCMRSHHHDHQISKIFWMRTGSGKLREVFQGSMEGRHRELENCLDSRSPYQVNEV